MSKEANPVFYRFSDSDGPWGVKCVFCHHTALATEDPKDIEHRSTCKIGNGEPGRYVVGMEGQFLERY